MSRVNLGEMMKRMSSSLEVIRIDSDEKPIVLFTLEGEPVVLHYCKESEIKGYLQCNGDDCVLCRVGKERKDHVLLPIYDFGSVEEGKGPGVRLLSVSASRRPNDLLPQLADCFGGSDPKIVFISRREYRYTVTPSDKKPDPDAITGPIEQFKTAETKKKIDLTSVYKARTNDQLRKVPEIARLLELKGLSD